MLGSHFHRRMRRRRKNFKVAWSIYVGWMPWGYAADSGIVKKWADKYGINIEVKQFNDYVEVDQSIHRRLASMP